MITPAVHTHFLFIYVPNENAMNKPENTNHTIVDSNVPKSIRGYIPVGPVDGQPGIDKTNSIEYQPQIMNIALNKGHNIVNK